MKKQKIDKDYLNVLEERLNAVSNILEGKTPSSFMRLFPEVNSVYDLYVLVEKLKANYINK